MVWSRDRAWAWYNDRPYIMGCNFVPSRCINGVEFWQQHEHEDVFACVRRELAVAAATGLNSVRCLMPFWVWHLQHDSFMAYLEEFLQICDENGLQLIPIFFDDCCHPRPEEVKPPAFGKQPDPVPGCHSGYAATMFDGNRQRVGFNLFDDAQFRPLAEPFVRDIAAKYAKDPRILFWDVINEPGNSNRGQLSQGLMEDGFRWLREAGVTQPVTAAPWHFRWHYTEAGITNDDLILPIERRALELSDIVSFHYYENLDLTRDLVAYLAQEGRPLVNTEWLHRPYRCDVKSHLPWYFMNHIGTVHWGLVNGKTQTHEPWDSMRTRPGIDLTRWQHDLYHGDGRAYDPQEIEVFRTVAQKAGILDA